MPSWEKVGCTLGVQKSLILGGLQGDPHTQIFAQVPDGADSCLSCCKKPPSALSPLQQAGAFSEDSDPARSGAPSGQAASEKAPHPAQIIPQVPAMLECLPPRCASACVWSA